MKKILISGSSGFVGSRVLHQWQGRAEHITFPRGSLAAADESDIRRFAETVQPDVILHLAALSDTSTASSVFLIIFVASRFPPIPTSSKTRSQFSFLKNKNATAVSISNAVGWG